jgi:hypothetical protein
MGAAATSCNLQSRSSKSVCIVQARDEHSYQGRRPPRGPHKVTVEVVKALTSWKSEAPEMEATELASRVKQRWGITVHPRMIEKALAGRAKRGVATSESAPL